MRRIAMTLVLAAGVTAGLAGAPKATAPETQAQHDARMAWWRDARFGMFIHWGLYAVPAGDYKGQRSKEIGEWIMSWANIPRADYEQFATEFNPVKFDAAKWVAIAKGAGMKYIVITSKHHEGFAMYDSAVSDYTIVKRTPWGKDPMAALSAEAKKAGLKFCFYYSIMDWHHPAQYVNAPGKDRTAGNHKTEILADQKAAYVAYMKAQLKELVTKYDPAVLWFDGEWMDWWTEADGQDLYDYVRGLKPDIIINNRVGTGRKGMEGLNKTDRQYAGDFGTPEQQIPANGIKGVDWESCMTMNDTWGFKSYDTNWKSAETIVRNLVDIASKGGNYLLNVGPTAEGEIPAASIERLGEVGKWMSVNGEAIYGTSASPFADQLAFGRATRKGKRLYVSVFDWPANGTITLPSWGAKPKKAWLVATKTKVPMKANAKGVTLTVPPQAPDSIATVVAIE
jgi:alpha-L-fucosidase